MFKNKEKDEIDIEKFSLDSLSTFVENKLKEISSLGIDDMGISETELENRKYKKEQIAEAIENAPTCDEYSKQLVKDYIVPLVSEGYKVNEKNIDFIIKFQQLEKLSVREKFEILLYVKGLEFGEEALEQIFEENELAKNTQLANGEDYYCVTEEDIERVYAKYEEEGIQISYNDKLEIIAQRVYADTLGNHCIDVMLEQKIDGISGGVNGVSERFAAKSNKFEYYLRKLEKIDFNKIKIPRVYDSVWIMYKGKNVHMSFLSFESQENLEKTCNNIYKFDHPGEMSQKDGYKLNQTAADDRVLVLRQPFTESWVFFIRKFDTPNADLPLLITGENADIVINALIYQMKGLMTTAITGVQGAGKTTLLLALIKYLYATYTLRIYEEFFELHARNKYPFRNIVTFREVSEKLDIQTAIDISKKTDGVVNIIQEVAKASVSVKVMKIAQVASVATFFGHHAKSTPKLVNSMRNDLLEEGGFRDEKIAEEQVVDVLDSNIHLAKTYEGFRCLERITQIIPEKDEEYPEDFRTEKTFLGKLFRFMETTLVFYKKMTNKKTYTCRNIIEYDRRKNRYVVKVPYTRDKVIEMYNNMSIKDQKGFINWLRSTFIDHKDFIEWLNSTFKVGDS